MKRFYIHQKHIKNHNNDQKEFYYKRCSEFDKSPIGIDKIVFLGDSITEGAQNWNKYFDSKNIVNRGISGDTTEGVLARLDEICYYKPLAVFLLIGINDIFNIDPPNLDRVTMEIVANNILRISDRVINQSTAKIFIQTILPINNKLFFNENGWFPNHKVPLNDQISKINTLIKNQSKDNLYIVIDLHSAFLNNNGLLNEACTTDGVHLNKYGYETWAEFIKDDFNSIVLKDRKKQEKD